MLPSATITNIILVLFVCFLGLGTTVEGFNLKNARLSCYGWAKAHAPGVFLQPELIVWGPIPAPVLPTKTAEPGFNTTSIQITKAATLTITAPLATPIAAATTTIAPTEAWSPVKAARTVPVEAEYVVKHVTVSIPKGRLSIPFVAISYHKLALSLSDVLPSTHNLAVSAALSSIQGKSITHFQASFRSQKNSLLKFKRRVQRRLRIANRQFQARRAEAEKETLQMRKQNRENERENPGFRAMLCQSLCPSVHNNTIQGPKQLRCDASQCGGLMKRSEALQKEAEMNLDYEKAKVRRLQAEVSTAEQGRKDLRDQIDELKTLKVKLQTALRTTFEEEKRLVGEVDALRARNDGLKTQLEKYNADNAVLQTQLAGEQAQATAREETMTSLYHERSLLSKEKTCLQDKHSRLETDYIQVVFKQLGVDPDAGQKVIAILDGRSRGLMSDIMGERGEHVGTQELHNVSTYASAEDTTLNNGTEAPEDASTTASGRDTYPVNTADTTPATTTPSPASAEDPENTCPWPEKDRYSTAAY